MNRAVALLLLGLFGVACSSETTAPAANALIGKWGGVGLELSADRSSVHAVFNCAAADFHAPLSPNAAGEFALPGTTTSYGASVQIGAHGVASGDSITIDVIRWYPGGSSSDQFIVVRDKPAELNELCALAAR